MPKIYSHSELLNEIRGLVEKSSQTEVAERLGIGIQMVNDIIHERRVISERIAEAMGYTREMVFRKKAA
jgi:plasmid maintenance system antidote protein VapI